MSYSQSPQRRWPWAPLADSGSDLLGEGVRAASGWDCARPLPLESAGPGPEGPALGWGVKQGTGGCSSAEAGGLRRGGGRPRGSLSALLHTCKDQLRKSHALGTPAAANRPGRGASWGPPPRPCPCSSRVPRGAARSSGRRGPRRRAPPSGSSRPRSPRPQRRAWLAVPARGSSLSSRRRRDPEAVRAHHAGSALAAAAAAAPRGRARAQPRNTRR